MKSQPHGHLWAVRYSRVGAGVLLALALLSWVTPVNVPGANLVPFGCGSPASPVGGELATFICTDELNHVRTVALVLLISAGLLLLLSEAGLTKWAGENWLLGAALAAPFAVPLLAGSLASLFTVVGGAGADGTLIRCGTAVAPAADTISTALCGHLVDRRLSMGLGGAFLGAGVLAGAAYVGHGLDLSRNSGRQEATAPRSVETGPGGNP